MDHTASNTLRNWITARLRGAVALVALVLATVAASAPLAAQGTVSGRVIDATTMRPLASAQVFIPDANLGTLTNAAGRFMIVNVPAGSHTIRAQLIGYIAAEDAITVSSGATAELDLALEVEALSLDAVVVTGTAGQARRREVGNTIASVDVGDVVEPVANMESLLQGRAAGVNVTMASGQAGDGAKIRLRGNVSAALSNQPLIYIDGVRVRSDGYPGINPITGGQQYGTFAASSPLNDINPNDIDRIEIIKGAAATTLYGTEAASGVIQIFTKRGQSGAPQWDLQTDQGVIMANKFGFRETLRGTPIGDFNYTNPAGGAPEYNFMDPWFRDGWRQNYLLSVRGGSQQVRYFVSGNLSDNQGLFENEGEEARGIRGNFSMSLSDAVMLDWNTSYNMTTNENISCGNNVNGLCLNAFRAPNNYLGTGSYEGLSELLSSRTTTDIGRLVTGATLRFDPSSPVTSQLTVGYDRADLSGRLYFPFAHPIVTQGNLHQTEHTAEILSVDWVSTYAADFGNGFAADFSAGLQSNTTNEQTVLADAEDFPGPGLPTLSSGAITLARENRQRVITGGVFGQALFKAKDRYFLTLGLRVDGNSAFGEAFGWQPYPKVSGSWVVSDEAFWPDALGAMKLRAAYGEAGRAPGAFDAVRTWSPVSWGTQSAFLTLNLGNEDLGPERSHEIEAGFESALFDNRLTIDFTAYNQRTTDALIAVNNAPSSGDWSSQLQNVGELKNQGIELSVNGSIIRNQDFGWDVGVNLSTNHSEVISLGGAPEFSAGGGARIREGYPVPVLRGDRITNPNEYAPVEYEQGHLYGPNVPTLIVTPSTTLTLPYDILFTARGEYQGGHYIADGATTWATLTGAILPPCLDAYPYIESGDISSLTSMERAWCIRSNFRSGFYIYPADFFKLRELSLQIPITSIVPGSSRSTLTLSGRNLFRWVKDEFRAWDPEAGGWNSSNSFTSQIWENPGPGKILTASLRVSF